MPDAPSEVDRVLLSLARSTAARSGGPACAVRDSSGRTYASGAVRLPSLVLGAAQAAVAQAAASGAVELVAAVVAGGAPQELDRAALRDLRCPSAHVVGPDGAAHEEVLA